MSPESLISADSLGQTLARVAEERGLEFETIDELCDIADEFNLWSPELEDRAARLYKKTLIRKIVRKPYKDEVGNTIEWMGVIQVDAKTGKVKRGYKQLHLFDVDDKDYVIRDRLRVASKNIAEAIRVRDHTTKKIGKMLHRTLQTRFQFLDEIVIPDA